MTTIYRDDTTGNWYHTVQATIDKTTLAELGPISSITYRADPAGTDLKATSFLSMIDSSYETQVDVAITFFSKCPTGDYDIKIASGSKKLITLR